MSQIDLKFIRNIWFEVLTNLNDIIWIFGGTTDNTVGATAYKSDAHVHNESH